jgi:DNA polymerase delta subunit 4
MATVNNQKQIDFPQVRSKETSAKIKKETPSTATERFPGKAAPSGTRPPSISSPTINHAGLNKENELEMLRQFDLCTEYGPCLGEFNNQQAAISIDNAGMPRLERWERAEKFGLNPPLMVYNIIKEHDGDTDYSEWYITLSIVVTFTLSHSLWYNEKGIPQ